MKWFIALIITVRKREKESWQIEHMPQPGVIITILVAGFLSRAVRS